MNHSRTICKCRRCGKTYRNPEALARHDCTGTSRKAAARSAHSAKPSRRFRCDECGAGFNNPQALGGHRSQHTRARAQGQGSTTVSRPSPASPFSPARRRSSSIMESARKPQVSGPVLSPVTLPRWQKAGLSKEQSISLLQESVSNLETTRDCLRAEVRAVASMVRRMQTLGAHKLSIPPSIAARARRRKVRPTSHNGEDVKISPSEVDEECEEVECEDEVTVTASDEPLNAPSSDELAQVKNEEVGSEDLEATQPIQPILDMTDVEIVEREPRRSPESQEEDKIAPMVTDTQTEEHPAVKSSVTSHNGQSENDLILIESNGTESGTGIVQPEDTKSALTPLQAELKRGEIQVVIGSVFETYFQACIHKAIE